MTFLHIANFIIGLFFAKKWNKMERIRRSEALNLCRLCGRCDNHKIDVLEYDLDIEKIFRCVGVQVNECVTQCKQSSERCLVNYFQVRRNDRMSTKICKNCLTKIDFIIRFGKYSNANFNGIYKRMWWCIRQCLWNVCRTIRTCVAEWWNRIDWKTVIYWYGIVQFRISSVIIRIFHLKRINFGFRFNFIRKKRKTIRRDESSLIPSIDPFIRLKKLRMRTSENAVKM